jgi:hypothetical protein
MTSAKTTTSSARAAKKTSRRRAKPTNGTSTFTAKVETIGPAKAQKYLDLMGRNRKKRGRLKQRYIDAMKAGQWKLTGEAIQFNTKGELINGQHRLEAVIESGKSIEILVCRGVPDEAFMELDTGGTRTPGDLLTVAGYDYTNGVASCIRHVTSLYEIEGEQLRPSSFARKRVDPSTLLEYAEDHSVALVDAVKKTMSKHARTVCGPPAMFAALYFVFAEHNKKAADEFFDALIDGIGFEHGKADPVYQLHRLLLQFKQEKHRRRPNFYKAAITIKAWNAFQNRDTIASLRFSENEGWPEINRRKTRMPESVAKTRDKKRAREEAKKDRQREAAKKAASKRAKKGTKKKAAKKKSRSK